MSAQNEYSIMDDLDDLEEQSANAGPANFAAARDYMLAALHRANIPASLMGGYSLQMRGSGRATIDIDIGVRARMSDLKKAVKSDARILYPKGPAEAVFRTFVKTGRPHDRSSNAEQLVQVDLQVEGPSTTGSNPASEMVPVGDRCLTMYDVMTMMKLKLKSFDGRDAKKDMQDIQWLVGRYEDVIKTGQEKLDYYHKERFLEALIEANEVENTEINRIRMVLGVAWPRK